MAGYTRQSTYTDGDIIQAADSNDEFDQLLAAFNVNAGHAHDGTAGEGPVIGLIGDPGVTTPINKVVVDDTNNRIGVFVDVASSSVEQLRIQDGIIVPVINNDIDLGTASLKFKNGYFAGNLSVDGNITLGGDITIGNADTDNMVVIADVNSNLVPNTDNSFDLGSVTKEWRNLYIDGTANIDSLIADTADINAGTIDGTVIGGSTAAAGSFTTIGASGAVTLSSTLGVTGTTTLGTANVTTGNITTVNATTVDTTNIEVTNIKAKDGTASATIADSTGVMTVASAVLTTADINGGTVDGTIIGGATPAAITGTTVTANTGFTGNLTGNVTGTVSTLSNHDTDDLAEGASNLYYTTARFDTAFSGKTTTDLTEGTNLYYTDARFDTRLATKTTTNLAEGTNLYYTDGRFDTRLATKTTDNVTEGVTNLYYTTARFDTAFSGKTTTDLTEGTNLYYTTARANTDFDSRLATKTTSDLTEGTNLYYTDARANAAIDARVTQTFVNNLNIDAATLGGDSKTTILATAQADALALAIALG